MANGRNIQTHHVRVFNSSYWFSLFLHSRQHGDAAAFAHLFQFESRMNKKNNNKFDEHDEKKEKHGNGDCDLRWIMWSGRRRCVPIYLFFVYFFYSNFIFNRLHFHLFGGAHGMPPRSHSHRNLITSTWKWKMSTSFHCGVSLREKCLYVRDARARKECRIEKCVR